MKFVFKLGMKNLFRYKERTFLTCLSLAVGICVLIFFSGMLEWADEATVVLAKGRRRILKLRWSSGEDLEQRRRSGAAGQRWRPLQLVGEDDCSGGDEKGT